MSGAEVKGSTSLKYYCEDRAVVSKGPKFMELVADSCVVFGGMAAIGVTT